jgi:hypothetical protein
VDDGVSTKDLRRVQRSLEGSVEQARSELGSRVEHLRLELDSFAGNWESAQDLHDALAHQQQGVAQDVASHTRTLRLIGQKLDWLIRAALGAGPPRECELDDVDGSLGELAAAADHGEQFKPHLLDSDARQSLQADVDRYRQWSDELDDRYAAALALSEAVAAAPAGAATPTAVAAEFRVARDELASLERDGVELTDRGATARQKLDADELVQREHVASIAAGEGAWRELIERLRGTIAEGVDEHALFPPWFCDSLGLRPSRGATDTWLELATEVAAYRITYGVTSRGIALGDPPPPGDASRRSVWHGQLAAALESLD